MKKKLVASLLATVMMLSLVACSTNANKKETEVSKNPNPTVATDKVEKVEKEEKEAPLEEITYWTNNLGDNQEAVKKFCDL